MTADTQIRKHRKDWLRWRVGREIAGHQLDAITKSLELLGCCRAGCRVLIQADQLPVGVGFE